MDEMDDYYHLNKISLCPKYIEWTRYTIDYQKCALCVRLTDRYCLSVAWIVSLHLRSHIDGLIKSKDIKMFLAKLFSLNLGVYYLQ